MGDLTVFGSLLSFHSILSILIDAIQVTFDSFRLELQTILEGSFCY